METATNGDNITVGHVNLVLTGPSTTFVNFANKVLWDNGDNVVKDFKRQLELTQIPFASQQELDRAFFFFVLGMTNTVNSMAAFNKEFKYGAKIAKSPAAAQNGS